MTPVERLAALERLDRVIRENNTWDSLRALGAYEDLWELAYGAAYLAVQVAAAARAVVEQDEPADQPEPAREEVVAPCCDLHGRNCEQGGDECCELCTEAHHFAPGHGGVPCPAPVFPEVAK